MKDQDKTKKQIIDELTNLRQRVNKLEALGTERKLVKQKIRESEELLKAMTESTEGGILVMNEEGKVTHVNAQFSEMWQIPKNALKTQDAQKLLNYVLDQLEESRPFFLKELNLSEIPKEGFDTLTSKDGRVFEHYSCQLIRGEKIAGRIWSFRDVTKRNKAAAALGKVHKELEKRAGAHTAELVSTNKQLRREIEDRKKAEEALQENEEHVHTLTQELMKVQEDERQRISRDLFDRIAQDLSTLKIGCETLFDNQPAVSHDIRQRASELTKILRGTIIAVRDMAYDLHPPSLDQVGLVQTVFQYCEDFSEKNDVSVDFYSGGMDDSRLDFDTKINLYRVIEEGLSNIKKHADASHVIIRLVSSFPNIILRIEDNGKGFDVEERLGLANMEERVSLLEGTMKIQSRPMQGTRILIAVPYKEKKSG
jgi:PAS domain S-box-containing protein